MYKNQRNTAAVGGWGCPREGVKILEIFGFKMNTTSNLGTS